MLWGGGGGGVHQCREGISVGGGIVRGASVWGAVSMSRQICVVTSFVSMVTVIYLGVT